MFTIDNPRVDNPSFDFKTEDGLQVGTLVSRRVQDFELNDAGFPMNDISALNGAKSVQEYQMLLQKIQMYQAENPDTSGLTVAQLINTVQPRFAQAPAEICQAAEYIGSRMNAEYMEKVEGIRAAKAAQAVKAAQAAKAAEKYVESPSVTYSTPSTTPVTSNP